MSLLQKLESEVNKHSVAEIAKNLGCRSQSTVYNWLRSGKIPNTAKLKVQLYLEKNHGFKAKSRKQGKT